MIKEYRGFKLFDTVYVLDVYDIKEVSILEFFEDYADDESDYKVTWIKHTRGFDRLGDCHKDESSASRNVKYKQYAYDIHVTRGY